MSKRAGKRMNVTGFVTKEQASQIDLIAEYEVRSRSYVVQIAVEEYLEKNHELLKKLSK